MKKICISLCLSALISVSSIHAVAVDSTSSYELLTDINQVFVDTRDINTERFEIRLLNPISDVPTEAESDGSQWLGNAGKSTVLLILDKDSNAEYRVDLGKSLDSGAGTVLVNTFPLKTKSKLESVFNGGLREQILSVSVRREKHGKADGVYNLIVRITVIQSSKLPIKGEPVNPKRTF